MKIKIITETGELYQNREEAIILLGQIVDLVKKYNATCTLGMDVQLNAKIMGGAESLCRNN